MCGTKPIRREGMKFLGLAHCAHTKLMQGGDGELFMICPHNPPIFLAPEDRLGERMEFSGEMPENYRHLWD